MEPRLISIRNLRYIALLEATTFLALLLATYLKYSANEAVGVQILGPIHGPLFVAYVLIAVNIRPQAGWSIRTTLGVLLGAVLPFGGYAVDRWLSKNSRATVV